MEYQKCQKCPSGAKAEYHLILRRIPSWEMFVCLACVSSKPQYTTNGEWICRYRPEGWPDGQHYGYLEE